MADTLSQIIKIIAILAIIPLGYLLKKLKVLEKSNSKVLNQLFIKVTLPATLFLAFSNLKLQIEYAYYPLIGLLVVVAFSLISYAIARLLKLEKTIRTVFLVIMPTLAPATIAYPFFMEMFGEIGLATISLFNIGNIIFLFSVDKYIVSRLTHTKAGSYVSQFFHAPVIWATILGLLVSYLNINFKLMSDFFQILSNATIFIIMISLGVSFDWKPKLFGQIIPVILTKTGLGLLIGFILAAIFGFSGIERISLIIFSFVPASVITYIFISKERLAAEFEADLLSFALPTGAFLTAILLIFRNELLLANAGGYIGAAVFVIGVILLYYYTSLD